MSKFNDRTNAIAIMWCVREAVNLQAATGRATARATADASFAARTGFTGADMAIMLMNAVGLALALSLVIVNIVGTLA